MEAFTQSSPTKNPGALAWIDDMAKLCRPDSVYWCDGSDEEKKRLTKECLASGELAELDQTQWPGCYWSRSDINDVARTEQLTFICSRAQEDSGVTNNWMSPRKRIRSSQKFFAAR